MVWHRKGDKLLSETRMVFLTDAHVCNSSLSVQVDIYYNILQVRSSVVSMCVVSSVKIYFMKMVTSCHVVACCDTNMRHCFKLIACYLSSTKLSNGPVLG